MITKPPAKLKVVAPFILRGLELEKANPIIAYYCFYTAVEQIITQGLQDQDDECKHYAINLIEELEKKKAALGDEPAILDKMTGQAVVEDFALRVFKNAETALRARKATKRTAETFRHAALFMQLLKFFGDLEPETAKKITFAKFQANRILKAISAGEDPNLPEEKPKEEDESSKQIVRDAWAEAGMDSLEQRTPGSQGTPSLANPPAPFLPETAPPPVPRPYAQSVSDEEEGRPRSRASGVPPAPPPLPRMHTPEVPSAPSMPEPQSPQFPSTPSSIPQHAPRTIPSPEPQSFASSPVPPPTSHVYSPEIHSPTRSVASASSPRQPPALPQYQPSYQSPPPTNPYDASYPPQTSPQPPPAHNPFFPPAASYTPPPQQHSYASDPTLTHTQPPAYHHPPPQAPYSQQPTPVAPPPVQTYGGDNLVDADDSVAIKEAQKHAKWAVSALNFEDVPTAVKELRSALKALGARV